MDLFNNNKIQFERVYSNHYQLVYGAIYSKTRNLVDTDDLTQEVFLHYYSKMGEVENIIPWLYGAIRYVLLNHFRKLMKFDSDQEIDEHVHDEATAASHEWRDTRIILQDAIESLEKNDRIIFELVAIQNLTYGEAGKNLSLKEQHIKYRYSVILKNIKSYLDKRGIKNLEDLL